MTYVNHHKITYVLPGASNLYCSAPLTGETAKYGWQAGDVIHLTNCHTSAICRVLIVYVGY